MERVSITRSITRISHEIIENLDENHESVLIGIHNRGVPLATRIKSEIFKISGIQTKLGFIGYIFPSR